MHEDQQHSKPPRRTLFVALLALTLLAVGCASLRRPGQAPPPTTVKMVVRPFLGSGPFGIAQEEGYFAEQGITIEPVTVETSAAGIPILANGGLDVLAGVMSVALFNAISHGENIRFVASQGSLGDGGCAHSALVARKALVESGQLRSPADLRGKRIAYNRANFERFHVETLLAQAGLTSDDLELVDIPDSAELGAMEQGALDVAYASEPTLSQMVANWSGVVWMPIQEIAPDFQLAVVMFGPSLLEQRPEVGERFMVAYLKAVRQYNQGKTARNVELMANFIKLDQGLVKDACWLPYPDNGQINAQSVLDLQNWAVKSGLMDAAVPENGFWEPRFVNHANATLGQAGS